MSAEVVDESPDDAEEHREQKEPPADDQNMLRSGKSYANTVSPGVGPASPDGAPRWLAGFRNLTRSTCEEKSRLPSLAFGLSAGDPADHRAYLDDGRCGERRHARRRRRSDDGGSASHRGADDAGTSHAATARGISGSFVFVGFERQRGALGSESVRSPPTGRPSSGGPPPRTVRPTCSPRRARRPSCQARAPRRPLTMSSSLKTCDDVDLELFDLAGNAFVEVATARVPRSSHRRLS